MSTDAPNADDSAAADAGTPDPAELQAQLEELQETVADLEAEVGDDRKKMTIIATKGSLDMAYPPLILATTAAAFDWDVVVFHTFWGLDILHEERVDDLKLSAVGNPSMPMPNALAALPGMDRAATWMMNRKITENGTASIRELLDLAVETGVRLQACQMTMDLMDYEEREMVDGVEAGVGAATALEHMADADIQLLV